MLKINLIVVGEFKEEYLKAAEKEYLKRLSLFASVKVLESKEHAECRGDEKLLREEKELLAILNKVGGITFLLDIDGKSISSEEFAKMIEKQSLQTSTINFIIGGSNGVSEALKSKIMQSVSFGKITLPHQLCRIVLLEQIYRAFTILTGKSYHK